MELREFKAELPKEALEVGQAFEAVLKSIAGALEDGWQPAQDLPAVIVSAVAQLGSAVDGLSELPEEFKAQPALASLALVGPLSVGAQALLDKLKKD